MKKILILILLILLSSFVTADYIDDLNTNILAYYKMQDVASPITDATGNFSFAAATVTYGATGILNTATLWGSDNYDTGINSVSGNSYSVNLWLYPLDVDDNTAMAVVGGYRWIMAGATDGFCSSNKFCCRDYDTDSDIVESTTSYDTSTWTMVTCICNTVNNTLMIAVNGTIEASDTSSDCGSAVDNWEFGDKSPQDTSDFDGRIDEVAIFENYVLNQTHIDFLFNLGAPSTQQQYSFSGGAILDNLTLINPINDTIYNNWTGNITVSGNININDCYTNITAFNTTTSNNGTHFSFINTTPVTDGWHYFNITCNDSSGNLAYIFPKIGIDVASPTMNSVTPQNGSFMNSNTLWVNATFTDNIALWEFNITIYNGSDVEMYSNTTSNISENYDVNTYYQNDSTDITSWQDTQYFSDITLYDTHTDKILNMEIIKDLSDINNRKIIHDFQNSKLTLIYNKDYDISYNLEDYKIIYVFSTAIKDLEDYYIISCNKPLYYLPKSIYSGHIICGYIWHDLEGLNYDNIEILDKNNIKINFNINNYSVTTKSTGTLNKATYNYTFFVDRQTPIILNITNTTTYDKIYLNITTNETVNLTYIGGANCTDTAFNNNISYNTQFYFNETGLTSNTTYYFNITILDYANNKFNNCYSITTNISLPSTTTTYDQASVNYSGFFILLIWGIFFVIGIYKKEHIIIVVSGIVGVFASIWFFNHADFDLISSSFGIINGFIILISGYFSTN